jgi:hypothetical protein
MNKLILSIFTLFTIVFVACKNDDKAAQANLTKEIMAVHDEVMPKMGELDRLKKQLSVYKDAVPDENAPMKDSLINAILLLSKMEDNMMDWMGNFKQTDSEAKPDERLRYLQGQRDSVKQMSNEIYMSLSIAQELLKNAPDSLKNN